MNIASNTKTNITFHLVTDIKMIILYFTQSEINIKYYDLIPKGQRVCVYWPWGQYRGTKDRREWAHFHCTSIFGSVCIFVKYISSSDDLGVHWLEYTQTCKQIISRLRTDKKKHCNPRWRFLNRSERPALEWNNHKDVGRRWKKESVNFYYYTNKKARIYINISHSLFFLISIQKCIKLNGNKT